jgi:hypothetical protein
VVPPLPQQQQLLMPTGKALMQPPQGMPHLPYWGMMPPHMLDSTQDSLLRPPAA